MMSQADFGWQVRHGDVAGAVAALREILALDAESLDRKGELARDLIRRSRTRLISCGRVCDAIEGNTHDVSERHEENDTVVFERAGDDRGEGSAAASRHTLVR
jgi:hypothetical protein